MNKQRRNELTLLKYKKRLRRYVAICKTYVNREGKRIYCPKTIDLYNSREQLCYKTTSTPCSCELCSGIYKYKRHKKKIEDRKIIQEGLEK